MCLVAFLKSGELWDQAELKINFMQLNFNQCKEVMLHPKGGMVWVGFDSPEHALHADDIGSWIAHCSCIAHYSWVSWLLLHSSDTRWKKKQVLLSGSVSGMTCPMLSLGGLWAQDRRRILMRCSFLAQLLRSNKFAVLCSQINCHW